MSSSKPMTDRTYVEMAPLPSDPSIPPSIYWIELRHDQAVEWLWTVLPDGHRVVTGYCIVQGNRSSVAGSE